MMELKVYNHLNMNTVYDKNNYYLKSEVDIALREQKFELLKKILGPITPVGETREDEKRLGNLKEYIAFVDDMINDLLRINYMRDRYESSIRVAGQEVNGYMKELKDSLNRNPELE